MNFKNFVKDQPDSNPYAHMDYDLGFSWNAKDDANDKDNGFICKRPLQQQKKEEFLLFKTNYLF